MLPVKSIEAVINKFDKNAYIFVKRQKTKRSDTVYQTENRRGKMVY